MEILIVLFGDPKTTRGGIERSMDQIMKLLLERGDLSIHVSYPVFQRSDRDEFQNDKYHRIPILLPKILANRYLFIIKKIVYNLRLKEAVKKQKFDAVVINAENGVFLAGQSTWRTIQILHGSPGLAYVRIRSHLPLFRRMRLFVVDYILEKLLEYGAKRSNIVASVSPAVADYIGSITGRADIGWFPNGIDIQFFVPPESRVEARRREGLGEGRLTAIWVGSDPVRKRLELAVKSILSIANSQIIVIGARYPAEDPRIFHYHNISDEKLRSLYQSADIFLFPSLSEGMSISLMEAMACGCVPVIGGGAYVKGLTDESNSFIAKEDKDFPTILERISNNPEKLKEKAISARRSVEKYTLANSTNMFLDLIKQLI